MRGRGRRGWRGGGGGLSWLPPLGAPPPPFSAGSWFHSLHATSHALQPMQTVVSVKNPRASAISRLLHVADERLALVDRHVGISHPGGQVVDDIAGAQAHPAPVPGHADVVDALAADIHHADAVGDERLCADVAPRARDDDPIEVLDPFLLREPLAELDEQLGLEFGEPRQPAAHGTGQVVLGEAVRADDVRELRVTYHRELVVGLARRPDLVHRAGLLLVQRVVDRRLVWLVVRSEEHTSELQSQSNLVCRLLLEKKKNISRADRTYSRPNSMHSDIHRTPSGVRKTSGADYMDDG